VSATVIHGDCLDVMRTLAPGSVDAVVCDPPYMVGAISVGDGGAKAGTWADMENSAYWFAEWMRRAQRGLKPTGWLLSFCNWRSVPTMIRALSLCGMPASSCMVWDKKWIGPAGLQQLRPRYEMVMFAAMPDAEIADRSQPDMEAEKWMAGSMKLSDHPAEKPVPLLQRLVRLVTPPGGLVVDPFCGSGSVGVACVLEGRDFLGIEREPEWCEVARRRIAEAQAQGTLDLSAATDPLAGAR